MGSDKRRHRHEQNTSEMHPIIGHNRRIFNFVCKKLHSGRHRQPSMSSRPVCPSSLLVQAFEKHNKTPIERH